MLGGNIGQQNVVFFRMTYVFAFVQVREGHKYVVAGGKLENTARVGSLMSHCPLLILLILAALLCNKLARYWTPAGIFENATV